MCVINAIFLQIFTCTTSQQNKDIEATCVANTILVEKGNYQFLLVGAGTTQMNDLTVR